ncbi:HAD family phosphatase, partial [Patescibacteria group bacterium]|nr:HAD family phosphatase [Patescibacteria group bacterium]
MDKFKLVCFDVDGTLVDSVSWFLLTEGLGCSSERHSEIFSRAKKQELSFLEGERMLTQMYRESGNATQEFIRGIFSRVRPKSEAKGAISYLKQNGYSVYLISGAIDMYVEEIARKLEVDGFYANSTLEFDSKGVLERLNYRGNQGEVKAKQLSELVDKLGIGIHETVFVGDS